MGRPRAFDEDEVVRAAVGLFGGRAYDGVSVDDLVTHLGVHRNSLYQVFGSKRGLYLRALRWSLQHQVRPLLQHADLARLTAGDGLDLLLLAAVERAPVDPEVAQEVGAVLAELDAAAGRAGVTAALLGLRLRARVTGDATDPAALSALLT